MSVLELPAYLAKSWDHWRNPTAWVGVREALGKDLVGAIQHEHSSDRKQVLATLYRLFVSQGGSQDVPLCDVLAFPRRQPPSRQAAPRTVRLPLKSAIETELAEDVDAA